ncbi:MAG: hypothetical protein HOC70_01010 [Gammaproteobacteria bacterium]|jgi:hypothetical protein|nr:hypothetical protein [Gammaproteobacteria bacterium]MBT4491793.1 hypothetical protein [Gammaproteobacteria bacterium]MBT7369667.1 hypothetical protein [Gammaproteobacteria bacterium]
MNNTLDRWDFVILTGIFLATRVMYLFMGLHFDLTFLESGLQFIDPLLLKERLIESLFFYHAKPPLMNLIAGIGLKLFDNHAVWLFSTLFHILGLLTAFALLDLISALSNNRKIAWIAVTILLLSPSFVLFENWFMYTFPVCALLTISAWLLYRYLSSGSVIWGAAFFSSIMMLVLSRALFHFYWFTLVLAILVLITSLNRKQMMTLAALPLLVCLGWYGKNLFLFGSFSSSSLLGLSLSNVSTLTLPRELLQQHVDRGELSRFATVSRYRDLPKVLNNEELAPRVGIPVLDDNKKSNGNRNFNSLEMKIVNELYLSDAFTVIQLYPDHYLNALIISNRIYFSPGSMSVYFSEKNRRASSMATRIYNFALHGAGTSEGRIEQPHFGYTGKWFVPVNTGYLLVLLSSIVFLWASWRSLRTILTGTWTPRNITIGYIFGNLLLLYLAGTLLELAENNRYRYIGEPLSWVLVIAAGSELFRWLQTRAAANQHPDGGI